MVKELEKKRLLVLGTNVGSTELVNYAKSKGAYVIVTDNLPKEKSEAKQYADETAMISTLNVDELCRFGKRKQIDGVFCGVSEVNLLSMRAVAERLGLPCYFTKEQWDLTENKAHFKELCERFHVPVAKRYCLNHENLLQEAKQLDYPVVVKPVDRSAGIGIHVCNTLTELLEGYQDAYEKSFCHQVIVEQFLSGVEYTATYNVVDGEIFLSAIYDRHLNHPSERQAPVTEVHVYPSRYIESHKKYVDNNLIEMMKAIGFRNGSFFVQGVATRDSAYIFEAGLRLAGSASYRVIDHINGINMLHAMTEYALTGIITTDLTNEDVYLDGKVCCVVNILCREGMVGKIEGFEKAKEVPGIFKSVINYQPGDTVPGDVPLKHIFMRFYIVADSTTQMLERIHTIQKTVKVLDKNGDSMIIPPLDPAEYLM